MGNRGLEEQRLLYQVLLLFWVFSREMATTFYQTGSEGISITTGKTGRGSYHSPLYLKVKYILRINTLYLTRKIKVSNYYNSYRADK